MPASPRLELEPDASDIHQALGRHSPLVTRALILGPALICCSASAG